MLSSLCLSQRIEKKSLCLTIVLEQFSTKLPNVSLITFQCHFCPTICCEFLKICPTGIVFRKLGGFPTPPARTLMNLFPYHIFHLCNSTTTYSAGPVPNDLCSWDIPFFLIFHFILVLYTFTLSKMCSDHIVNMYECHLHVTIFYKHAFLRLHDFQLHLQKFL